MKQSDTPTPPPSTNLTEDTPPAPKPPAPTSRQQSQSLLSGSIKISGLKKMKIDTPPAEVEAPPLTENALQQYWNETAEELQLQELMQQAEVHLSDQIGHIEIIATSVTFHEDFKPHRIDIMEGLRRRSHMPMLDCNVKPLFVTKDALPYTPNEKYLDMLKKNPQLENLRKLFPQIDI